MREKNRKPIASYIKLPQFTTMNVIDGQAGVIIYSSLICYSLTIDNILNIIVLLILAGVTIVTLTGDNGLLQKSTSAKQDNEDSKELELIKLSVSAAQVAGKGTITTENLNNELKSNLNSETDVIEGSDYWYYAANKNYRIYKDGKIDEGKLLPDEYQQLEYIESTGTQYIDTNLLAKTYNKIYVKIEGNYTITTGVQRLFGAGFHTDWKTNFSWALMSIAKNSHFVAQNGIGGTDLELKVADTQKHTFILDTELNLGWVDDISKSLDSNGLKLIDYNYLLFSINNQGVVQDNASFKMYSCEIKMNNVLIRKYIPCYCKEAVIDINGKTCPANTKGLYDLVEGKFYTNKDTRGIDFTPGPEV